MRHNICKNRQGVLELPMQYVIAVVVAGIAISLIFAAASNMRKEYQLKKAIREVNKIVEEAENMYSTGNEGTQVTLDIDIPNSVKRVVFGSSNDYSKNQYYILMDWGENESFFAKNAKFVGDNTDRAIIYGGTKRVILQLVMDEYGEKYVKISPG